MFTEICITTCNLTLFAHNEPFSRYRSWCCVCLPSVGIIVNIPAEA